jgi:hypothetical protein
VREERALDQSERRILNEIDEVDEVDEVTDFVQNPAF